MEPWIQTYTGKQFWPLNPKTEDVCIEDIAHALSLKCRFGGHCKGFYSVADHSIRVANILKPADQLAGLLHDAAEAYLPDVAAPIKSEIGVRTGEGKPSSGGWPAEDDGGVRFSFFDEFQNNVRVMHTGFDRFSAHEDRVLWEIFIKFGVSGAAKVNGRVILPKSVKQADRILLATEARDLMSEPPLPWQLDVPVLPEQIVPNSPADSEKLFLYLFHKWTENRFSNPGPEPVASITDLLTQEHVSITAALAGGGQATLDATVNRQ